MEKAKRMFITGGSGYIRSNIIRIYFENGWKTTAYVRDKVKSDFLNKSYETEIIEGDIEDNEKLFSSALDHDVVIHAADVSSDVAIKVMDLLTEACKKTSLSKKSKFIFCSGCMVNGSDGKERDEFVECDCPKKSVEWKVPYEQKLLKMNDDKSNLNFSTAVIRPSWVYGYNTSNYFNDYLKYCKDNKKVPVFPNSEENTMSFVHVHDVGQCFYKVGSEDHKGIFNITDSKYVKVKDLTEKLSKLLNAEIVDELIQNYFYSLCMPSNQKVKSSRLDEIKLKLKYPSLMDSLEKVYEELYSKF